jgi:hypothetical protein
MTMLVSKFSPRVFNFHLVCGEKCVVRSVLDARHGPGMGPGGAGEPQGSITIGTFSDVIIQISTMSALVTAMQPSVQSWVA